MEEATVRGTVKIKGKLANKGEIKFNPDNAQRKVGARTAPIGKDGTYTIKTLVGDNGVNVQGPGIPPNIASLVQTVKVEPGENTIDIQVPRPPAF